MSMHLTKRHACLHDSAYPASKCPRRVSAWLGGALCCWCERHAYAAEADLLCG